MKTCRDAAVLLLPLGCAVLLLYCSGDVADSGGGLDIGNPSKICIVDSLNRPVAHASVKIIASDAWFENVFSGSDVIADSALTDNSGVIRFDAIAGGDYNLQIDHPTGGAFVRNFHSAYSRSVDTITIRKYGSIAGSVSSTSGVPARIRLAGTAYSAPVGSEGVYTLPAIPEGLCYPVIMAADSQWAIVTAVDVVPAATIFSNAEVSFSTLLIDDFEDSANTGKVGRFVDNSYLYAMHADIDNASAHFQIMPEGIGGGNALQGTLITRDAWALVGLFLGVKAADDSVWDFRSAKGFSFYARGNGRLNVSFESDSIDKMESYKHYSADIVLHTDWRHYFISFDSLTFKEDANPAPDITWEASARSIKRIEFNALEDDTVQFWLDDLTIDGVDFSSVY
ncbi:MAG: hypothetical protein JXA18_03635 [Chitinispirillaceae bacterium]|nr:hypothetical protein [Chitinispirillaceae bacterium]